MLPRMIVGLGNPGVKYAKTRHNAGFRAIDCLAGFESFKSEAKGLVAKVNVGGRNVLLVKPQTFMNLSGECVQALMTKHKIKIEEVLVVVDDIQLDCGKVRIRLSGSHGGQNGLRDIIRRVGDKFPRVRIGVGKVPQGFDVSRWVLSSATGEEAEGIVKVEDRFPDILTDILQKGYQGAMAKYNGALP